MYGLGKKVKLSTVLYINKLKKPLCDIHLEKETTKNKTVRTFKFFI